MTDKLGISGFMHKYYDWAAFELFVKDLYNGDGDVEIERDVTERDCYGAKRQTDIKITRRTRFSNITTLIECKRWKEPVGRDRIDVLASSMQALGAQHGAVFTTTGYEEGAVLYAKGKGIDLFLVRELTEEEWGGPGKEATIHMHYYSAEFFDIKMAAASSLQVDVIPSFLCSLKLGEIPDPKLDLFSNATGEKGFNICELLRKAHELVLRKVSESVGVFEQGQDLCAEISVDCNLDFCNTEFCELRLCQAQLKISQIDLRACIQVDQKTLQFDRSSNLDFALMVENYVSQSKLIARRQKYSEEVTFNKPVLSSELSEEERADQLPKISLLKVVMAPHVRPDDRKRDLTADVPQLLKMFVLNEGVQPLIELFSIRKTSMSST